MKPMDAVSLAGLTIAVVAIFGAFALVALHLLRRASIRWHLVILGVSVASSMAGSFIVASELWLITGPELGVMLAIAAVSMAAALALAGMVGRRITREARRLQALAVALADATEADVPALTAAMSAELGAVSDQLVVANERLRTARAAEARLDHARREFLSWISHDLRTPVAGMRAVIDALADDMVNDPTSYLDTLRTQGDRLALLIDDVFQLSVIDSGQLQLAMEAVDLGDLVSDAIVALGPRAHERVVMREPAGAIVVDLDPTAVSRALLNVITNALRHAPTGPVEVEIGTRNGADGSASAWIAVTDTGPGLSHEHALLAFEPGWQSTAHRQPPGSSAETGGAGLGLAIVRGLIEAHGGTAQITSSTGDGCRVELQLPSGTASVLPDALRSL